MLGKKSLPFDSSKGVEPLFETSLALSSPQVLLGMFWCCLGHSLGFANQVLF